MGPTIDPRLQAFLANPVMVVAASRDSDGRSAIARCMGVRLQPGGASFEVFISETQWAPAVKALTPGALIAVTVCRPESYETYQVKGAVETVTAPDAEGLDFAASYCQRITDHLLSLGPILRQVQCWITTKDLVCVRLSSVHLFNQTPGPNAGKLLAQGPA